MKGNNKYLEELVYATFEMTGLMSDLRKNSFETGVTTDLELGQYNLLYEKYELGLYVGD